jgi:hypothetical protein
MDDSDEKNPLSSIQQQATSIQQPITKIKAMKFITSIILTGLLAFIAGLYLPWWSLAIAAFAVAALIHQKPWKAFLSGFLGLFLLWGGLALWINFKNDGVLAVKVASLLPLGGSPYLLIVATGIVSGLIGGLYALTGSYLRSSPGK